MKLLVVGGGREHAIIKKLKENPTVETIYALPGNGVCAVEGILSPDGRIFGKMGHSERIGSDLCRNVLGNYELHLFEAAKAYFSL